MSQLPIIDRPPAPAAEKIIIKVDGNPVAVPKTMPDPLTGKPLPTTMIQACALAKVEVPHYCYHPKLPVAGKRRLFPCAFRAPGVGAERAAHVEYGGTPKNHKSIIP